MKVQVVEQSCTLKDILKNIYAFFNGRERVIDVLESKRFTIKTKGTDFLNFDHSKLRIFTPK